MTSAVEALADYIGQNYSLVILDMQLFDMNSMELLQTMRRAKRTPILVLTCPLCTEEIVGLFCAGADAYLTKPVNINICVAQAKALIQLYQDSDDKGKRHDLVTFGTELMIDPRYRQVFIDGKLFSLTRKEFNLLYCLASYPEQVFSLEHLYSTVWGDEPVSGGEETVRVHIQSLRRKLASSGKDFVQNIWGVGYKFVPPQ